LKQSKTQRSYVDVTDVAPSSSFARGRRRAILAKHFHGPGRRNENHWLETLWNQMQINQDADAMGKWLDSDFVLTDYDGTVLTKGQFLSSLRDKSTQLTVEVSEDMKLHRHGDTVIVTGSTHEKGTEKGKPFSHVGRFTDTWVKKDGQWLCVAGQLSLIGK
jgi:ketosteroid isomerase-like protein